MAKSLESLTDKQIRDLYTGKASLIFDDDPDRNYDQPDQEEESYDQAPKPKYITVVSDYADPKYVLDFLPSLEGIREGWYTDYVLRPTQLREKSSIDVRLQVQDPDFLAESMRISFRRDTYNILGFTVARSIEIPNMNHRNPAIQRYIQDFLVMPDVTWGSTGIITVGSLDLTTPDQVKFSPLSAKEYKKYYPVSHNPHSVEHHPEILTQNAIKHLAILADVLKGTKVNGRTWLTDPAAKSLRN